MTTDLKSYNYKGFMIVFGLCENHPDNWHVRDFNDYDEAGGSSLTEICTKTIRDAKEKVNLLIKTRKKIPF